MGTIGLRNEKTGTREQIYSLKMQTSPMFIKQAKRQGNVGTVVRA